MNSKQVSESQVVGSSSDSDDENGTNDGYDLETCIEECGGIEKFFKSPTIILYNRNLQNQTDLENYILEHLPDYKDNICLFPGVKGSDEYKQKINGLYRSYRSKSTSSTILFKGSSSKSTPAQQILMKNKNMYLYVDAVMKNKISKMKKIKVRKGTGDQKNVGNLDNNTDDESEDCGVSIQCIQKPHGSPGCSSRASLNWKGGSKNCGFYRLFDKQQEVKECVSSVLSYGRDHGVLLSGVQLKALFDIQNVEITKSRANDIVQLISTCVDVIINPHFVTPTAKGPIYEISPDNKLIEIYPTRPVPVPSSILESLKKVKENEQLVKYPSNRTTSNNETFLSRFQFVEMVNSQQTLLFVDKNNADTDKPADSAQTERNKAKLIAENNCNENSSSKPEQGDFKKTGERVEINSYIRIDNDELNQNIIENHNISSSYGPMNELENDNYHENFNKNIPRSSTPIKQQKKHLTPCVSMDTDQNESSTAANLDDQASSEVEALPHAPCIGSVVDENKGKQVGVASTSPFSKLKGTASEQASTTSVSTSNAFHHSDTCEEVSRHPSTKQQGTSRKLHEKKQTKSTASSRKKPESQVVLIAILFLFIAMNPKKISKTGDTPALPVLSQPSSISSLSSHSTPQNDTLTQTQSLQLEYKDSNPLRQQQYQDTYPQQSQLQVLSQDEWNLILSFRMMKNLTVLPSCQLPFSVHHQTNHSTLSARIFPPSQSDDQESTSMIVGIPSFSVNVPSFSSSVDTVSCPPIPIPTNIPFSAAASLSITISPPTSSSAASTISLLPLPHHNDSFALQFQSQISTSAETIVTSSSNQSKGSNQYSSASSHCHQLSDSNAPITYNYDSLSKGPLVQLLDPTKPYTIGDALKVGGRVLTSDISSMKYWVEDDIIIAETAAGGHILHMGGYSYLIRNHGKNFTAWECQHRRKQHCSSIVIRSSDPTIKNYFRIYSIQGEHIHESSPEHIEIRTFKERIRDRCRDELSSPRKIYEDELLKGKYSTEMLALLPTFYNMHSHLYRIRLQHLPTSPTDHVFVLHPGFTTTDKGERFLLYDSMAVDVSDTPVPAEIGRLLIYSSDLQLSVLSKSLRVGSDGTFATAAQISQQNYVLMGDVEETHAVPLVFCLCERKTYETYQLIIKILKNAMANLKLVWNPHYWMSDFEGGLIRVIKEEFPETEILGCTFHYCQAIYRNIQSNGLQESYQNIDKVQQIFRHIMALAFIPYEQIRKVYFEVIKPELNAIPAKPVFLRQNIRLFFKYFESYWLKRIDQFCVFDYPTRTNNGLEGYNNKMTAQLNAHPHLYRLLVWFEKEELLVQQIVAKLNFNQPVYKRKQTALTILINDSLQSLWDDYKAGKLSTQQLLFESSKWVAKKL
ncbi:unnamed protein product [Adineta ricciae]|uniref:MULE transposase domain-containing protein n=1 Tax=Adineta ricciae TaxID=249248 RepID=A0A815W7U5_ADIRI|nr:unnamed protein product [Adineta ricciae]